MKQKNNGFRKLLCPLLLILLSACQNGSPSNKIEQQTKDTTKSTQKSNKMSNPETLTDTQVLDWREVNTSFMNDCLSPFLEKKHIISDCTRCPAITLVFTYKVDANGKITLMEKGDKRVECKLSSEDIKQLEDEIVAYMKKQTLPTSFHNTTFKALLGFVLKC